VKYTEKIIIKKPIKTVINLFDSEDNLYSWQEGLQQVEHISGKKGEVGAKMKLIFKLGKRTFEMVETITKKNFPSEFEATYEASGVFNIVGNHFLETEEGNTEWTTNNEFRLKGFMRLFGWFSPGTFKKQTCKTMDKFKEFAESK
jgi:hypothetical protein